MCFSFLSLSRYYNFVICCISYLRREKIHHLNFRHLSTHVLAAVHHSHLRADSCRMRSDAWRRGFAMNRCNHAGVGRKRGQKGTSAVCTHVGAPGKTTVMFASTRDGRQTDSKADPGKCYFASRLFADVRRGGRAGGRET